MNIPLLAPFRRAVLAILWMALVLSAFWGVLALWIDSHHPILAAASFAVVSCGCLFGIRPHWRGMAIYSLWLGILLWWWLGLEPRNDRNWQADVARTANAELSGDQVVIRNVRDFTYRSETDYTPRWETRNYDLGKLDGADLFLSDWGAEGIVHTIASWEFEDGRHLAISIEARKEAQEGYSALRGFFRQYELYYVVADERDVIGLRAADRGEKVHLYRVKMDREEAKKLLLAYLGRINRLAREPEWYNALTANCTTTIRFHVKETGVNRPLNWRLFANKYVDELLYQRESINTAMPFEELRVRSDVTAAAKRAKDDPGFSELIRAGLPPRPVPDFGQVLK